MRKSSLSLLFLSILISLISCKDNKKVVSPVAKQEIAFKKEGVLSIYKKDSLLKTINIEIADNAYETETGLMYRKSMDSINGMLFIFSDEAPRYFYMKNTEIALDIIYINSNQKIVSIAKNTVPLSEASIPSNYPAKYVLEINAGLTDKWSISVGDSISYTKINP